MLRLRGLASRIKRRLGWWGIPLPEILQRPWLALVLFLCAIIALVHVAYSYTFGFVIVAAVIFVRVCAHRIKRAIAKRRPR